MEIIQSAYDFWIRKLFHLDPHTYVLWSTDPQRNARYTSRANEAKHYSSSSGSRYITPTHMRLNPFTRTPVNSSDTLSSALASFEIIFSRMKISRSQPGPSRCSFQRVNHSVERETTRETELSRGNNNRDNTVHRPGNPLSDIGDPRGGTLRWFIGERAWVTRARQPPKYNIKPSALSCSRTQLRERQTMGIESRKSPRYRGCI